MPGEKMFTESFRGYNKKEVNDYIEGQNRAAAIVKEGLEFQVSDLERQKNELSRKFAEISAENKKYVGISKDLENAASDIENQRNTIIALKEENEVLRSQIALRQEKVEKLTQKLQNSSQSDEKSGNTVLSTEKKADDILRLAVEKAQKQSEEIKAQTEAQVSQNIKKVKLLYKRRDELKVIFDTVKTKTDELYSSVSEILSEKE